MAKTLVSHPHILSSTSRSFCEYLLPSKRLFLCKTRIYVNESFLLSRNYSGRNKLQIHTNSDIASNSSRFGFAGYCRFTTKATHVNDAGSIDSPLMQSMEKKIKESLDAELVSVKDAYGDGRHVSIDVVSSAFEGKSAVNRQRMVYKAIWEELQSTVHAVDQMTTRTPAEAETQK